MYDILESVRVVELASWTFVPAAGTVLADWGADVVKIEHPVSGDPQRGLFNALGGDTSEVNPIMEVPNRGKRSIGLDITTDAGYDVLTRMISRCDVFLTSQLPQVRRKLRVDVEDVRRINPDAIYGRGTGQGFRGPEAERGGFDAASFWARGGIAHKMTLPGGEPPGIPGATGDLTAGALMAGAIAAALYRRQRSGITSVVDLSLYSTGMWTQAQSVTGVPFGFTMPYADRSAATNPLSNLYRTKDDRWISLMMLQADRWWPDLAQHLGIEELVTDPRFASMEARFTNRSDLIKILDSVFATATLDEWRERLATTEGVWAPVASALDISQDAQAMENGYLPPVYDESGAQMYRGVASPAQFDERPIGSLRRAPEMGEHTEELLLEWGYTWEDIIALKEHEAIN